MPAEAQHPCARCARMQRTCCQRAEVFVTTGDRVRIERHTGRSDFWSSRVPEDPAYLEPDPEDPEWLALTTAPDGRRPMLRRRPDGACTFLGDAGCELPVEVRPLVCRLYPFSYTARGIDGHEAEYCPTEALLPPHDPEATMLTVLDMPRVDGERWRCMLYDELRSRREHDANRADVRSA